MGVIDRSDQIMVIYLFGMFIVMYLAKSFPPPWGDVATWGSFFFLVGLMFIQGVYLQFITGSYSYIRAKLRPSEQVLHLFCDNPRGEFDTKQVSTSMHATTIPLAWPVNHHWFGKINKAVIVHEHEWNKRVHFKRGKCIKADFVVDHPQTVELVLNEPQYGGQDMYHAKPIPVFTLANAPGDRNLPMMGNPVSIGGNPNVQLKIQQLQLIIERQRAHIAELARENMDKGQAVIKLEEVVSFLKNEILGLLKATRDFRSAVTEYMLTIREAQITIENALKKRLGPRAWFGKWLAWPIAAAIIVIPTLWYLNDNPQVVQQIFLWWADPFNKLLIFVLAVITGATVIYIKRRRK